MYETLLLLFNFDVSIMCWFPYALNESGCTGPVVMVFSPVVPGVIDFFVLVDVGNCIKEDHKKKSFLQK